MQYLGVFTRHDYADENGVTKSKWYRVGYIKLSETGGKFLRLFHQPETKYYCFETEDGLPEIQIEP